MAECPHYGRVTGFSGSAQHFRRIKGVAAAVINKPAAAFPAATPGRCTGPSLSHDRRRAWRSMISPVDFSSSRAAGAGMLCPPVPLPDMPGRACAAWLLRTAAPARAAPGCSLDLTEADRVCRHSDSARSVQFQKDRPDPPARDWHFRARPRRQD